MNFSASLFAYIVACGVAPNGDVPAWVSNAVAWGSNQKAVNFPAAKGSHLVTYSTPYLRVAMAAHAARREGRSLDVRGLPDGLTAPELHVFASMVPVGSQGRLLGMAAATSVTLIVAGERLSPSRVEVQPKRMGAASLGGELRRFEGRELMAVFPLNEAIPSAVEVVVEYSWAADGRMKPFSRKYKLDLGKVHW